MADTYTGALLDERDAAPKLLDFHSEEVPLAAGPRFEEVKKAADLPFYERRDQDGSSTCMNQAYAKARGIITKQKTGKYVPLSGGFAYRRKRTAGEGMALWDLMDLGKNHGLPFEAIDPSQNMSEAEIVHLQELPYADDVAKLFTDPNEKYLYLPNDFDAIAAAAAAGYPVIIMQYADRDEYGITPTIKRDLNPITAAIRHGVAATKPFAFEDTEYLLMDESWGIPNSKADGTFERDLKERGQRRLTREWVNKRVYGAAYIRDLTFNFDGVPVITPPPDHPKPRYRFTKTLKFLPIEKYDSVEDRAQRADVTALQNILKYEGIFDAGTVSSGYYGAITARAVEAYQRKHNVAPSSEIDQLVGPKSVVGPKTIADLNSRYAQ